MSSRGVPGNRGKGSHGNQRSGAASGTAPAALDPGEKIRRRSGRFGWGSLEGLAAECQLPRLGSIGEEAEMTDTHEARRQDVEQKPADELTAIERHGLLLTGVLAVLVGEGDVLWIDIKNPVIGNGGAVGVAAEIGEHGFRRSKGLLGVDHPLLLADGGEELFESRRVGQQRGVACKGEFAFLMSCGEEIQKLGAEDNAERRDRKQEIGAGCDPSRSVEAERAAWNQTVKMIVTAESLIPGVKDGEKSDLAMQVRAAEVGQGFRDGLEEDGNHDLRVHQENRIQFVGDREDHVEVTGWKKFLFVPLKPAVRCGGAALGTGSVAARVEARMFGAAGVTPLHVPAQHFGAAGLNGAHHFQMGSGQFAGLAVVFSMKSEHVGEFPARP